MCAGGGVCAHQWLGVLLYRDTLLRMVWTRYTRCGWGMDPNAAGAETDDDDYMYRLGGGVVVTVGTLSILIILCAYLWYRWRAGLTEEERRRRCIMNKWRTVLDVEMGEPMRIRVYLCAHTHAIARSHD